MLRLRSSTLTLLALTPALAEAELASPAELGRVLGVCVPPGWPPGEYDREALNFFRNRLVEGGDAAAGWYSWYAHAPAISSCPAVLAGAGGFFGPPDAEGLVEIGFSVLPEFRCQGIATELTRLLTEYAFAQARVRRITARVAKDNAASLAVLGKAGFRYVSEADESGFQRFQLVRPRGPASSATAPGFRG